MLDEAAGIARLPSPPAEVILQRRQRAGPAHHLHQHRPRDDRQVHPHQPPPAHNEQSAGHRERDEQEVEHHDGVGEQSVEHVGTSGARADEQTSDAPGRFVVANIAGRFSLEPLFRVSQFARSK
jgi:hypothetical protein